MAATMRMTATNMHTQATHHAHELEEAQHTHTHTHTHTQTHVRLYRHADGDDLFRYMRKPTSPPPPPPPPSPSTIPYVHQSEVAKKRYADAKRYIVALVAGLDRESLGAVRYYLDHVWWTSPHSCPSFAVSVERLKNEMGTPAIEFMQVLGELVDAAADVGYQYIAVKLVEDTFRLRRKGLDPYGGTFGDS